MGKDVHSIPDCSELSSIEGDLKSVKALEGVAGKLGLRHSCVEESASSKPLEKFGESDEFCSDMSRLLGDWIKPVKEVVV